MPLDPGLVSPAQDRVAGELGAVVADDHPRRAACRDQPIEFGRHLQTRERGVGDQGDVLAGAVVDDRQNAEAAAIGELVRDEPKAGEANSRLHRSFGRRATCIGARVPRARFRPPRCRTPSLSSR